MNRLECVAAVIDQVEAALASTPEYADIPVRTWGGVNDYDVPVVFVKDGEHERQSLGNSAADGVAKNDAGDVIGQYLRFAYEADVQIIVAHQHETVSYQLIGEINDHFSILEAYPERLDPSTVWLRPEDVADRGWDFRLPDTVFQQELPLNIRYENVILDDSPEPLEQFHNEYESDGNPAGSSFYP